MRKTLSLLLLILATASLAACQPKSRPMEVVSVAGGSYRDVSASELQEAMSNEDLLLINVHVPFAGNIAGTDASIPYDQIARDLTLLPADKSTRIVLYCRSGRMSTLAAEVLVKVGFTNIWNLKGGMVDWERAGFVLED